MGGKPEEVCDSLRNCSVNYYSTSLLTLGRLCCSCCFSVSKLYLTICDLMDCSTLLFSTISLSLLRFRSIESVILSNHLILCHLFLLLPSIFPNIEIFCSELTLHIKWLGLTFSLLWLMNTSICQGQVSSVFCLESGPRIIECKVEKLYSVLIQAQLKNIHQNGSSPNQLNWRSLQHQDDGVEGCALILSC